MRLVLAAVFVVPVVLLAGCSSEPAFQQEFTEACQSSSNLSQPICDCMARKAEADLGPDEREFVLASLKGDDAETTRLRTTLGIDGAMRAGMFMTNVAACAAP